MPCPPGVTEKCLVAELMFSVNNKKTEGTLCSLVLPVPVCQSLSRASTYYEVDRAIADVLE